MSSTLFRSRRPVRTSHLAAVVVGVILAVASPRVYAQLRIAVVDMQRALVETNQGQHAKTQLKGLFQKRQVELDARQTALKHLRDDLEKQHNTLDQATLQHRMEDYQKQFVDLQQNFLQYQQELAQREAELTKQIYSNLEGVIRQIGQSDNLTVVFEQSGVIWSPQHLDITDRAVQAYNQQYPVQHGEPASSGAPPSSGPPASHAPAAHPAPAANPHPRGDGPQAP